MWDEKQEALKKKKKKHASQESFAMAAVYSVHCTVQSKVVKAHHTKWPNDAKNWMFQGKWWIIHRRVYSRFPFEDE